MSAASDDTRWTTAPQAHGNLRVPVPDRGADAGARGRDRRQLRARRLGLPDDGRPARSAAVRIDIETASGMANMAQHHAIDRRALITGRVLDSGPRGRAARRRDRQHPGAGPPGDASLEVEAAIVALAGCEIHGRDPKGKLVVVVEAPDAGALGTTLNTIALLPTSIPRRRSSFTPSTRLKLRAGRTLMTNPKLDRRQILKLEAAAMAAAAGGMSAPALAANLVTERDASELKWDKAACRFCGTGCSVMVATKDNRVVATHGDIKSEVNRGLNCVKGYFLSKIMYGHDRLTQPMLRKTGGKYDKNGEFTPVSLGRSLRHHGGEVQGRAEEARAQRASACSAPASGRSGKAMPPSSCSRPASAPTTSIPMRATAWPPRSPASCAPSASTSRWAATTTSRPPTPSCCGAPTWRRCTRSCGRG